MSFTETMATAKAETSLYEFVKEAWSIVEDVDFVPGWHLEAICAHLEASFFGRDIGHLVINVPPGFMKSLLCAVFFPAWAWVVNPGTRLFFISYEKELATRDSMKTRKVIGSDWYQERWGHLYNFAHDQDKKKTRFENSEGGWRMSGSVGGRGTGEHPDLILVDDPHKAKGVESLAERTSVQIWWDSTMTTRGVSRNARRIIIMQRLHVLDLCGHIFASEQAEDYTHLCLPMRYEPDRMKTTGLGWNDPRTEPGELLWPELFTEEKTASIERGLGTIRAAGQLQQRPMPAGGQVVRRDWFRIIEYS